MWYSQLTFCAPKNEFMNTVSICVNKLTLKKNVNYLNDFINSGYWNDTIMEFSYNRNDMILQNGRCLAKVDIS